MILPPKSHDSEYRPVTAIPSEHGNMPPVTHGTLPSTRYTERGNTDGGVNDGPVGAFLKMYVDAAGDTYLQCGSVTGGNGGSASIADYKVIDEITGPVAADGQILYIQANCTATVEDGIMLPGCLLNSATTGIAGTVPSNHSFTTSALTGNIYLEIGRWADSRFLPSGPAGNLYADGCIGSFSITRI